MKFSALSVIAFCVCLAGCGGGGGGSTSAPAATSVQFAINWPALSRGVQGPSDAMSVVIELAPPSSSTYAKVTANRNGSPGSYTATYSVPLTPQSGEYDMTVNFYSQLNGLGLNVARALGGFGVLSNGSCVGANGQPLAVTAGGTLSQVSVPANQVAYVGVPMEPVAMAEDDNYQYLALPLGGVTWNLVSGPASINSLQQLVATAPGTVTVTATVNGQASASQTIQVFANSQ